MNRHIYISVSYEVELNMNEVLHHSENQSLVFAIIMLCQAYGITKIK
jgi:hypothetical protein